MCGRFARKSDPKRLAKEFGVAEVPQAEPSYNVAPTHSILVVREGGDGREMTTLKWGLVPSWAKDASIGAKLINARSETVEEKPSFREAFRRRRCVIPADGFYEWLGAEQLRALSAESVPGEPAEDAAALVRTAAARIEDVLQALRSTPDETLAEPREVGRAKLPSTVFGLLFHIAEHTQRHTGQIVTTARIVRGSSRGEESRS